VLNLLGAILVALGARTVLKVEVHGIKTKLDMIYADEQPSEGQVIGSGLLRTLYVPINSVFGRNTRNIPYFFGAYGYFLGRNKGVLLRLAFRV